MATPTSQALIVTEDNELGSLVVALLEDCGAHVVSMDADAAREYLRRETADFIVADLDLGRIDPVEWIRAVRDRIEPEQCLLLASPDSLDHAAAAAHLGLRWYQKKPIGPVDVRLALARARSAVGFGRSTAAEMLGSSPGIQSALKGAAQVAPRGGHLTVVGEPGAGKRLLARYVHEKSRRAHQPFRHFSCDGLSEWIVDGELFGREDPHGASEGSEGLLRQCHQGTLVIDEISRLPLRSQERLLKCLTLKSVRSLGAGAASAPCDVRIIACSSRPLEECLASGAFLRELFDRVSGVRLELAPLRERKSDIPLLADHFVRRATRLSGRSFKGIAQDGLERLMRHDWPGNVRELEDIIAHSVDGSPGPWLVADDLPSLPDCESRSMVVPGSTIQEIEREAILKTLEAVGGSTGRAARILNMSVRKIQYKLKEYRRESASTLRTETVRSVSAPSLPTVPPPPVPKKKTVFVAEPDARD